MKLLFINHRDIYHPQAGGAEVAIFEVAKRLVRKGIEVFWLSESVGKVKNEINGVKLIHKGNKYTIHLHSLKYAKNFDIVIDSIAHAVPFFSYLVNNKTIALIHHVHQDVLKYELNPIMSVIIGNLEKFVSRYKNIIAVSETTKRELVRRFKIPEERIKVIYNGVDHEKYKPTKEKAREPTVMWIGRLKKYKNPLDPIRIFKRLRNDIKARLIMIGSGDMENEVIEAIGDDERIKFLGRVSEEEKIKFYQTSWVLLSTSFIEGWGMTIIEANACGTPAIAYATGSLQEVIKDGENGFLVGYKDYERVIKLLEYLLEDENIIKYMSKKSYEHSLKFDWDMTANEYYNYITRISYE